MPWIGAMKDLSMLKKMEHAATCHLNRLTKEMAELAERQISPSKELQDKVAELFVDRLAVRARIAVVLGKY